MEDGKKKKQFHYYEGISYKFHEELWKDREDVIFLYFAWGDGRSAGSVFDNVFHYSDTKALRNIYLHPVVEVNGLIREAEEDLDMIWNTKQFTLPIKKILVDALRNDLAKFYPKPKYMYRPYEVNQTESNAMPYEKTDPDGLWFQEGFMQSAAMAVHENGAMYALKNLRAKARATMPWLEFHTSSKKKPELKEK